MAGIGVLQYGYGVAVTALHATNGSNVTGALWVLALWVVFQAGAAAPTAALSHRFAPGSVARRARRGPLVRGRAP